MESTQPMNPSNDTAEQESPPTRNHRKGTDRSINSPWLVLPDGGWGGGGGLPHPCPSWRGTQRVWDHWKYYGMEMDGVPPPPPDACENITFPHPSNVVGNNDHMLKYNEIDTWILWISF